MDKQYFCLEIFEDFDNSFLFYFSQIDNRQVGERGHMLIVSPVNGVRPTHPPKKRMSWVWLQMASDSEAPVLEIWRVWCTSSLLLPGPLWPELLVALRVPSMVQIELFKNYSNLISYTWYNININNYKYKLLIGLMSRVFTNRSGDLGSIPGWVIRKTQKMILDGALLNTQHYKVCIEGKVKQ